MQILRLFPLLALFLFCFSILFYAVYKKKMHVKISVKYSHLQTIFSSLFLLLFLYVFVSELLFQAQVLAFSVLPSSLNQTVFASQVCTVIGNVLLLLSLLLLNYTFVSFRNSFRFGRDSNNLGELIKTGVFNYSRNPFFSAILLLFWGIALVFPTPFFIGIALLSTFSIHLVILKEEKFMRLHYGEEYLKYCEKVRRYF